MRIFSAQVTHTPSNVTCNSWLMEVNTHVGRRDSIKKGEIHLRCTVLKRKIDVKRLDGLRSQQKVQEKASIPAGIRTKRFIIYLLDSRYNKIIEMQYFI